MEDKSVQSNTPGNQDALANKLGQDIAGGFNRYIKPWLRVHPRLAFIIYTIVTLLVGGGGGVLGAITIANSSSTNFPGVTYIRNVAIIDNVDHFSPIVNHDIYMCEGFYDTGKKQTRTYFKDVDEGNKNNSTDVYGQCQGYVQSNTQNNINSRPYQLVTLLVTGRRDPSKSDYCNIIQIVPQNSTNPLPDAGTSSDNGSVCTD